MVKLLTALESLKKNELLEILKENHDGTGSPRSSISKKELIAFLEKKLTDRNRLRQVMETFNKKELEIMKLFLHKKYRYQGMRHSEFTKFLIYNNRMKNNMNDAVKKLRSLGLLFFEVPIKKENRVACPSEILKFFDNFIKAAV
ncbi:MAG: hypothetical protein ACTSVI_09510 [Promethearchaeota archaeon]